MNKMPIMLSLNSLSHNILEQNGDHDKSTLGPVKYEGL